MSKEIDKAIDRLRYALGDIGTYISSTDKRKTMDRVVRDGMYNEYIDRDNKYYDRVVIDELDLIPTKELLSRKYR